MSGIQQTCFTVIDQITTLYDDKEEMKKEVRELGFTAELKDKLIVYLEKEIEISQNKIEKYQKQLTKSK